MSDFTLPPINYYEILFPIQIGDSIFPARSPRNEAMVWHEGMPFPAPLREIRADLKARGYNKLSLYALLYQGREYRAGTGEFEELRAQIMRGQELLNGSVAVAEPVEVVKETVNWMLTIKLMGATYVVTVITLALLLSLVIFNKGL